MGLHACFGILKPAARQRWFRAAAIASSLALLFAAGRLALLSTQIGGGPADAFNPDTLSFAWSVLSGPTIVLTVGVVLLPLGIFARANWVAGLAALAIAASFTLTGHSQSLDQPGFAPLAVGLHVLIAGYWLVAPLTLHPTLYSDDQDLIAALERFSRTATFAIPALILLGVWLAWRLAGGLAHLFLSIYGWLLIAKLSVALIAMSAGALNKGFITGLVRRDPARGRAWLSTTLATEASLFILAIILVSLATTIFPPMSG